MNKPIHQNDITHRGYDWKVTSDLGFIGSMSNGTDTRDVNFPACTGCYQMIELTGNITLTLAKEKTGIKYKNYTYKLDSRDPDSFEMEVYASAVSISGHLRFEDEDLLAELEEIGLENIIKFGGISSDPRLENIEEVPYEELHRKYYLFLPFEEHGRKEYYTFDIRPYVDPKYNIPLIFTPREWIQAYVYKD